MWRWWVSVSLKLKLNKVFKIILIYNIITLRQCYFRSRNNKSKQFITLHFTRLANIFTLVFIQHAPPLKLTGKEMLRRSYLWYHLVNMWRNRLLFCLKENMKYVYHSHYHYLFKWMLKVLIQKFKKSHKTGLR